MEANFLYRYIAQLYGAKLAEANSSFSLLKYFKKGLMSKKKSHEYLFQIFVTNPGELLFSFPLPPYFAAVTHNLFLKFCSQLLPFNLFCYDFPKI
jgi:hypothetical protein